MRSFKESIAANMSAFYKKATENIDELNAKLARNVGHFALELTLVKAGLYLGRHFAVLVDYLDWLDLKFRVTLAMVAELTREDCEANLDLLQIRTSDLNEHILCAHRDLGCFRVDDGRQREDLLLRVVKDWVLGLVSEDGQKLLHFDVILEHTKQLLSVHALSLLKRLEADFGRWMGLVRHREANLVKVVSAHGGERPSSADVVVELVLEIDERIVALHVELDVAEDARDNEWPHFEGLRLHDDSLHLGWCSQTVVG